MNLDIVNIKHYRVTSHGGRAYDLFNRDTDEVYAIKPSEYAWIREENSLEACEWVENLARREYAKGKEVKDGLG